eukprot:gnl/TRDRNA2_/TRDRNA2_167970_c1_seq2.p1 gnl/TRDRNA2_/TRDRNA2_167970_c1~~gnl/TRDRNA2_/TRDRNA2_167970_c1_seq2.p1  ORF type:complete len:399 (-),score=41.16 gnl/TRDRNA2_/TRDRNA2_167970_c1_seq2:5-1201(-)
MNAMGLIFQAFSIIFIMHALTPFQTFKHPVGERSVIDFPLVLMGSSEWWRMATVGCVMTLILVGIFCGICLVSVGMRRLIRSHGALPMSPTVSAFLLKRFKPEAVFWTPVQILRGFVLSIVPTIPMPVHVHVLLMGWVLLIYLAFQCHVNPFCQPMHNIVEAVSVGIVILCVFSGGFFIEFQDDSERQLVVSVVFLNFMFLLIFCAASLAYSIYAVGRERTKCSSAMARTRRQILFSVSDTASPIDCEHFSDLLKQVSPGDLEFCRDALGHGPLYFIANNSNPTASEAARLVLRVHSRNPEATTCKCGHIFMDDSKFCPECGVARPRLGTDMLDPDAVAAARQTNNLPVLFEMYAHNQDVFALLDVIGEQMQGGKSLSSGSMGSFDPELQVISSQPSY